MAKKNYDELIDNISTWVGGENNVTYFTHCITRLRFNVKDKGLVDLKAIENAPNVIGSQWSGDQLQIIIGQNVATVYKGISEKTNFSVPNVEDTQISKTKKSLFNTVLDGISGCLTPLVPLLVAGGMLKICLILLGFIGFGPKTDTYLVFEFISDAAFYFLPVFVGAGAAKKFNVNMGLGMFVGAMLIAPNFVSMVNDGASLSIFGLPIYAASYSSTVFPVIISVFVMSYIERFFTKYSPEIVRSISVPLGTILVMIPLTLCLFGPMGSILGNYFASAMIWLYETLGFVGVGLFSAILPFVIFTGMHFGFLPYMFMMMGTAGYEPFYCVANFIYNITQGAASLAVSIKTKDTNMKSLGASVGFTAIVAGVSEPALFGVTFKLKKPLWCAMAGSFVGGIIAGLFKVHFYSFGSFGLVGLPGFIGNDISNLYYMIIALAVSGIATFVLTLLVYKDEEVYASDSKKGENKAVLPQVQQPASE
ncbi:PTS system, beta-glucoside-specific IIA component [Enterococcus sp. AZ135]|uniref:PTS transporter subunit EIIC n=1 Tax=unclassified Enterococcus TaxID=2608891 RepID=UPI003F258D05